MSVHFSATQFPSVPGVDEITVHGCVDERGYDENFIVIRSAHEAPPILRVAGRYYLAAKVLDALNCWWRCYQNDSVRFGPGARRVYVGVTRAMIADLHEQAAYRPARKLSARKEKRNANVAAFADALNRAAFVRVNRTCPSVPPCNPNDTGACRSCTNL
jgi:hypothetical protein